MCLGQREARNIDDDKVDDDGNAKNKLEWGETKCQVMQVGKKIKVPDEWPLGKKRIKNTTSYKYLGDMITSDNKNTENIKMKENKIQATIRQINTTASSDIMRGIETRVILALYDKCIISSLLYNSESWNLSLTEEKQVDKIGITAIKRLFTLPTNTPNVAVINNFGLLYL